MTIFISKVSRQFIIFSKAARDFPSRCNNIANNLPVVTGQVNIVSESFNIVIKGSSINIEASVELTLLVIIDMTCI